MRSKYWFYLCIVQSIVIFGVVLQMVVWTVPVEPKSVDLNEYLSEFSEENNYLPDVGYIPDAETAEIVGSVIIDKMTGNKLFSSTTVQYDEKNRLWQINKGYLFRHGGFIVIEQDSGKVIKALLTK